MKFNLKIKMLLIFILVFISLYGFKYLRDTGSVIPISIEGLVDIKNQLVSSLGEDKLIETNSVPKKEDEEIVFEDVVENKTVETVDKVDKVAINKGDLSSEVDKKELVDKVTTTNDEVLSELQYLTKYNVVVNKSVVPNKLYLMNCAKCHGFYGTGFENGKELLGGGIIHYTSRELYTKLMDYKNGDLESVYMGEVLKNFEQLKLRTLAESVSKLKRP